MFDHGQIESVSSSLVILGVLADFVVLDGFETDIPIKEHFQGRKITFACHLLGREGLPWNSQNLT